MRLFRKKSKLLVFAIDCMDYKLYNEFRDDLPFLRQFEENNTFGKLVSDSVTTFPEWTTFFTGKSKEEHGIPYTGLKNDKDIFTLKDVKVDKKYFLWNIIKDNGYSIGIYGLPMVYPIPKNIDWGITGWFHPKSYYPSHMKKYEVELSSPNLDIKDIKLKKEDIINNNISDKTVRLLKIKQKEIYNRLTESMKLRTNKLISLYLKHPVDVIFAYFLYLDCVAHLLCNNKELVRQAYINMDKAIKDIVDTMKPENIMLISDHGSKEYRNEVKAQYKRFDGKDINISICKTRLGYLAVNPTHHKVVLGSHYKDGVIFKSGQTKRITTDFINSYATVIDMLDITIPKDTESKPVK